jgi:hypothetical protein
MSKENSLDMSDRAFIYLRIIARMQKEMAFLKETILERDWQIRMLHNAATTEQTEDVA